MLKTIKGVSEVGGICPRVSFFCSRSCQRVRERGIYKMTKIVIVVEGGVVQEVKSTEEIEYVIVDKDVLETLDTPLASYSSDEIISDEKFEKIRK